MADGRGLDLFKEGNESGRKLLRHWIENEHEVTSVVDQISPTTIRNRAIARHAGRVAVGG
jgi:hypothetical protein